VNAEIQSVGQAATAPEAAPELNVVIVDDHVALRRGMELLLRRSGLHVVGTADNAGQAEDVILRSRPDVALIDLAMPGESGAVLTRRLLERDPDLRIILYTGSADEAELLEGLDAGAAGFALKSGEPDELRSAIRTVAEGGDYLDPRLTPLLARSGDGRSGVLSPREREILGLLAQGLSGEKAAKQLFLSSETVRTHVRNAMAKLGASTRVHAVALAMQSGEIAAAPEQPAS
jgi:DNA-binding NarL/FixJ family response regulator